MPVRKHLMMVLRLVVALGGVGYVAWAVDWFDHVEVASSTNLPGGDPVVEGTRLVVVEGRYDTRQPDSTLRVELNTTAGRKQISLPIAAVGLTPADAALVFVPGILTTLREADWPRLALGLISMGFMYPILMVRWWMLMRARGLAVSLWKSFRLTMVGTFFNLCMPGTTGGDVVKAYYAASGTNRRADAVMSVLVDRVTGLLGLLIVAGVVGFFMLDNASVRELTVYAWILNAGVFIGAAAYFSHGLRSKLGLDRLLSRLPAQRYLHAIDSAAFAYGQHKGVVLLAVAMSVLLQVFLVGGTVLAGYALGMQSPAGVLWVVVPLVILVGAIPISPQGIGVMEFLAVGLLQSPLASSNQIVGMLLVSRLYQIVYSLTGSLILLKGDIHLHPRAAEASDGTGGEGPVVSVV